MSRLSGELYGNVYLGGRLWDMPLDALDDLRSRLPVGVRHRIAMGRLRYRVPTARWRSPPGALVIGAQRSGTSSLFRYLGAHPDVAASFRKEVEYFSRRADLGERWYRAHFALRIGRPKLGFEATPDYLFHPLAPSRAAALVPDARLVVLLRDPVARAWSHHQHMVRLGYETLAFAAALAAEEERCAEDLARLAVEPDHDAKALLRYSYAARGLYAEQLRRWFAHFPRDQFLILPSEDFFADTPRTFATILDFLGLRRWEPPAFRNASRAGGNPDAGDLDAATAAALGERFRAPNTELSALLGEHHGI
ncbi:MAG: sulfotransferase family protein [Jiangellaceae bacterium]